MRDYLRDQRGPRRQVGALSRVLSLRINKEEEDKRKNKSEMKDSSEKEESVKKTEEKM